MINLQRVKIFATIKPLDIYYTKKQQIFKNRYTYGEYKTYVLMIHINTTLKTYLSGRLKYEFIY